MKNADYIKHLPDLPQLRRDLKTVEQECKLLEKRAEDLRRLTDSLSYVDKIVDGVAVTEAKTVVGGDYEIRAVGADIGRAAKVYMNARTKKDFCLSTYDYKIQGQGREEWLGTGYSFRDACAFARRWVLRGSKPSEDERKMAQCLGRIECKRNLPQLHREAFEAAWIAGHHDVAERIARDGFKKWRTAC